VAFGPLPPSSVSLVGTAGRAYGDVYAAAASTGVQYQTGGFGIAASIASNTDVWLMWEMPWGALPSGTCTLKLWARAAATANSAKVNPAIVMSGSGDDPGAQALTAEGTQTLTWAAGDSDELKLLSLAMDAVTIAHSKFLTMRLRFETASWTLAAKSLWMPRIVFE
jgi:hypothetical protein